MRNINARSQWLCDYTIYGSKYTIYYLKWYNHRAIVHLLFASVLQYQRFFAWAAKALKSWVQRDIVQEHWSDNLMLRNDKLFNKTNIINFHFNQAIAIFSLNQNEFSWFVRGSPAFSIAKRMIWKERSRQHCRNATKF